MLKSEQQLLYISPSADCWYLTTAGLPLRRTGQLPCASFITPTQVCLAAACAGAPYVLQPLADAFASEPAGVKLALLTAAAKLFFSRPPESQKLLGTCLAAGLNDSDQDVHDRALLYYRYASPMLFSSATDTPGPEPSAWSLLTI